MQTWTLKLFFGTFFLFAHSLFFSSDPTSTPNKAVGNIEHYLFLICIYIYIYHITLYLKRLFFSLGLSSCGESPPLLRLPAALVRFLRCHTAPLPAASLTLHRAPFRTSPLRRATAVWRSCNATWIFQRAVHRRIFTRARPSQLRMARVHSLTMRRRTTPAPPPPGRRPRRCRTSPSSLPSPPRECK